MSHMTYRRWFGPLYVALTGLTFMLISQTINSILMPGVPFYQPPFGMAGNILVGALIALILGWIIAWPETGAKGVLFSSLMGGLVVAIAALMTGQTDSGVLWARKITGVILIYFPAAAALSPLMLLFRWVMNREETAYRETQVGFNFRSFKRAIFPLSLFLIATIFAGTFLYNDLGRAAMPRMNALIQKGQQANSVEALPELLRPPAVNQFLEKGRGTYQLEWNKDENNRFMIPRPNTPSSEQSIVIAHFDNDYLLVCMFPSQTGQPECRDFLGGEPTS